MTSRKAALLSLPTTKTNFLLWSVPMARSGTSSTGCHRRIGQPHRDEHARHQRAVGVVEAGAGADGARAGADAIVEALDDALIDMAAVARQRQFDRDLLLLGLGIGMGMDALDIGLLVDIEIGIDAVIRHDARSAAARRSRSAPDCPAVISARLTRPEIGAFT